ncbi:DNA replication and repair protein RecN [Thermosyntropha lipolytica DSM 11003]|uniref:DNA repair protein RecN n=1 Tax=Thermosyntropha lipolytica DSM 11003 TaxID=1123382 RepID=A0A1M5LHL8_9FIRM|nr:DNA repair protein RecN [Thermosyntropha lipolytica]SHG64622.1 DNA replication and repair protein RecN [Thermosyntropha lipolytica DSM 11003]
MLQEIYINNFILIDELRLEFDKGLNVLTGETGAGKSIIIDALGLIMGERVRNDLLKDDSRKAVVEAVFSLESEELKAMLKENGFMEEEDESLIITREMYPQGRSVARINGHTVNITFLRKIAPWLVDMHLQHDHLTMLRPEKYLTYIDSFVPEAKDLRARIKEVYKEYRRQIKELEEIKQEEKDRAQKLDFLAFQINEIKKADLKPGEEEELNELAEKMRNAHMLARAADQVLKLVYSDENSSSAYDNIASAVAILQGSKKDAFLEGLCRRLEDVYYSLQEIAEELSRYRDSLDFEPGLVDEVEARLYEIGKLKKKYGGSVAEILAFLDRAEKEWERLSRAEERQEDLLQSIALVEKEYLALADELTRIRQKGAQLLEEKVNKELKELNMPYIKFAVVLEKGEEFSADGLDKAEFMFSPNPGEEMKPLSRIASGGEISRFILALKKALAEAYEVPTLIFDEIDVGVGGTALTAMAKKLAELSRSHQVILVTHSPQIASYAHKHYLIEKEVQNGQTFTRVKKLDYAGRIKELARMLGGENYSEITLKHAGEMLDRAILEA